MLTAESQSKGKQEPEAETEPETVVTEAEDQTAQQPSEPKAKHCIGGDHCTKHCP